MNVQLLAAMALPLVAERPQGEKVRLSDLVRQLTPTVADIAQALEVLVMGGALDASTLRRSGVCPRPMEPDPAPADPAQRKVPIRVTGAELFRILKEEGERRGMTPTAVSFAVFGNNSQLSTMRNAARPVRYGTRAKADAWLNSKPNALTQTGTSRRQAAAGEREAGGVSRIPPPASTLTGDDLADRLEAFITEQGLSKKKVSEHLFGASGGVANLRRTRHPKPVTLDKVEAFLADPPLDALRPRAIVAGVSGVELAAELESWIEARPGLSKSRIGLHLFGQNGAVQTLRRTKRPSAEAVAKVRGFIANPPDLEQLRKLPMGGRRPPQGHLGAVEARRRITRQAEALLDGDPAGLTSGGRIGAEVRAAANLIRESREAQDRQTDPVKAAQLELQRKGRTCFRASVAGRSAKKFVLSGAKRDVTEQELVALAAGTLTFAQLNEGVASCRK